MKSLVEIYQKAYAESQKASKKKREIADRSHDFFLRDVIPVVETIADAFNKDPQIEISFKIARDNVLSHMQWLDGETRYRWQLPAVLKNKRTLIGNATLVLDSKLPQTVYLFEGAKSLTVSARTSYGLERVITSLVEQAADHNQNTNFSSRPFFGATLRPKSYDKL